MPDKDVARERPARFFVWAGVFEMRQFKVLKYEQHLSERATEILKQMTELKQLRELVRLAEAAKAPKGLQKRTGDALRSPDRHGAIRQRRPVCIR